MIYICYQKKKWSAIQPHRKSTTQGMIFLSIIKTRNMQAKMTYSRNDVRPYQVFNKNEEEVATKSDMKHLKSNNVT